MRIIELCFSRGVGGLELYAAQAARHLNKRGHTVLPVGSADTVFAWRSALSGRFAPDWKYLSSLRKLFWLAWIVRQFRPEVIHVHHRKDLPLAAFARLLSPRPRFRLVYHRHREVPTKSRRSFYHRLIHAQVHVYILISEQMRKAALGIIPLPAHRQTTLLHGVAPACSKAERDQARAELMRHTGPGPEALRIGCFSRLAAVKGQHTVLRAAAGLAEKEINVQLLFFGAVGDPSYPAILEQLIKDHDLEDRVAIHGFVDDAPAFMACCDIVVHAATVEPFGLVVAEALAAGCAVIAADTGGVPEIIEHESYGLLFTPEDADELEARLAELIRNPEQRTRMARDGQAYALRKYSLDSHYERLEALFSADDQIAAEASRN